MIGFHRTLLGICILIFFHSCSEKRECNLRIIKGIDLLKAKDPQTATIIFKEILSLPSSNRCKSIAHHYLGKIKIEEGKYLLAVTHLSTSLQLDSTLNSEVYFDRGYAFQNLGDFLSSIKDFSKALSLSPDNYIYLSSRGYSYLKLKEYKKAEDDLKRSLLINPNYAIAYNRLGVLNYEIGKWDRSLVNFNNAIDLNNLYLEAYLNRAYCYLELGELNEAVEDLVFIKEQDSTYCKADYLMGLIYIGTGDTLDGCVLVKKAVSNNCGQYDVDLEEICG